MNAIVVDGVNRCGPQISTYLSVMSQLKKAYCHDADGNLRLDPDFVPPAEWMSAASELYIAILRSVGEIAMECQELSACEFETIMWTGASPEQRDQQIKEIMVTLALPNITMPRFRDMEKRWIGLAVESAESVVAVNLY